MYDYLLRFSPGEMIAIVSIVGGLFVVMLALAADIWQRARKVEIEAKLKRDLLDRGMSADEIRTILDAGKNTSFSGICDHFRGLWSPGNANR
jgi:hypothetical protein